MSRYVPGWPRKEDTGPGPMIWPEHDKPGPYRTNLRHPVIRQHYGDWCRRKGIPVWSVPTDEQRHEFDLLMIVKYYPIQKGGNEKDR